MKRFGHINENGVFTEAPKQLQIGNFTYFNPKEKHYKEAGFQEVVVSEIPKELLLKKRKPRYRKNEDHILLEWEEDQEPTPEGDSTIAELYSQIKDLEEQIAFLMKKNNSTEDWIKHKENKK